METTAQKIDLKSLDKSSWETFRFEEIASKISETVDPNSTTLETYVGLEHLDAEDIHIRRKGTPDDVSGGKLKCYPGDVIFGKRRAYQRKAAIVDFEGICSAHAFVFRANPEIIDPKLFPFFLHSDQFMHRMVDISVGGLSPTINWGDLKHQEFLLPPKDQQAQLAELLWAMDEVVNSDIKVLACLESTKNSNIRSFFSKSTEVKKIKELGTIITGTTPSTGDTQYWGGQFPFITPGDIDDISPYVETTERKLTEAGANISRILPEYSILTVCIGSTIGKSAIMKTPSSTNQQINAVIPKPGISSTYFLYALKHAKPKILAKAGVTAVPILNKNDFGLIEIPWIEQREMNNFENLMHSFEGSIAAHRLKITASKALQKSLINQIF